MKAVAGSGAAPTFHQGISRNFLTQVLLFSVFVEGPAPLPPTPALAAISTLIPCVIPLIDLKVASFLGVGTEIMSKVYQKTHNHQRIMLISTTKKSHRVCMVRKKGCQQRNAVFAYEKKKH